MQGLSLGCSQIDRSSPLGVRLSDLLAITNCVVGDLIWRLSSVEATGSAADELHRLSDDSLSIASPRLMVIAQNIDQIVDGRFEGYLENEPFPVAIFDFIDSTYLDIWSTDNHLLAKLQASYPHATEIKS